MCSTASPADAPAPRELASLEREITRLASHIHAATCRWLGLVAEFDRREGWAQWGCRSCAHWVSWRCGVAPVAAREHVRVAQRLQDLPLIREAFAHGRLSYSKVRALTRVDTVSSEAELLELARHATAAQLERLVRAYRGVVAVEAQARDGRAERWLTWSYDEDGSLRLQGRLPAEEGALVVAALEAAREHLAENAAAAGASAEAGAPSAEGASAEAAAPSADGASAEAAAPSADGASAEAAAPSADGASAEAAAPSADGASAEAAAPSADGASAEAGAPSAEGASAEAPRPSTAQARADALLLLADTMMAAGPAERSGGDRFQVVVRVDAAALQADETREPGTCELDGGAPLAAETARRLACDASVVTMLEANGTALDVGRKRRSVPPALRRAIAARDRGCRFPGCAARRFVDNHHLHHWAKGGTTDLANLVQLCRHHHRLLHEGGYTVDGHPQGELVFRRPDGRRINSAPRPPHGRPAGIAPRRRDPHPEATACVSLSHGEPLDLDLGVHALLAWTEPKEALGV